MANSFRRVSLGLWEISHGGIISVSSFDNDIENDLLVNLTISGNLISNHTVGITFTIRFENGHVFR